MAFMTRANAAASAFRRAMQNSRSFIGLLRFGSRHLSTNGGRNGSRRVVAAALQPERARAAVAVHPCRHDVAFDVGAETHLDRAVEQIRGAREWSGQGAREVRLGTDVEGKDRKSTRLNSSHLGISYAVFCLKKKK